MIRVGPAGWSYRDWEGIIYPKQSGLDQLEYLAQFFDTIEINSTFYRPATAKVAESWVRRTEHNPRFRFTLKLTRSFTHERETLHPTEVREWKEGVAPLQREGKMAAVLIQFPWSFRNQQESRAYLVRIMESFSDLPLVAEFRHASWDQEGVLEFLRELKVGICNIDQPVIGRSIEPRCYATSPLGYFRCHGRNYRHWFRKESGRDQRYDYLYTDEEVEEQAGLVGEIQAQTEDVYVIYNNHYRGQAAVKALQLRRRLEGVTPPVPETLQRVYGDPL